jgi:hypothetical protein
MEKYKRESALVQVIQERMAKIAEESGPADSPVIEGYMLAMKHAMYFVEATPAVDVAPRAEVALEVIGAVEKMARDHIEGILLLDNLNGYCFGGKNAYEHVIKFLAEIKKKYTEQRCTDCKHFAGCECFSGMTCDEFKPKEGE